MTKEIPREEWKTFFDELSREKQDWETTVEVMKDDLGAQVLSSGLPLVGFTIEEKDGRETIDFSVGTEAENHQTHSIENPSEIGFLSGDDGSQCSVSIKDESGTTTLIRMQPTAILVSYTEIQTISETF